MMAQFFPPKKSEIPNFSHFLTCGDGKLAKLQIHEVKCSKTGVKST